MAAHPADAALATAGVGDQNPRCTHTDDGVPCVECFLDGGESDV